MPIGWLGALGLLFAPACIDPPATVGRDLSMGGDRDGPEIKCAPPPGDLPACACSVDDYAPRFDRSRHDTWPACNADDGTFRHIGLNTPTSALRTMTFMSMGMKLWRNPNPPLSSDFLDARAEYSAMEGIASRLQRRQDVHYPEIPGNDNLACSDAAMAARYPDRCAGPNRLLPVVTDAFAKGQIGVQPRVQAARLEASLLWFFYLSILSEQWACGFDAVEDCDAQWGSYTQAQPRGQPTGLAGYIRDLHQETHDRVFDGVLAARCWRDIDRDLPTKRLDLYRRASDQTDKALTRGMALILRDRLGKLKAASGDVQDAHLAFVNVLGGLLDRAARAQDAGRADTLKQQVGQAAAAGVDVAAAQGALDALFSCP